MPTLDGMGAFRVLVAGPKHFSDYATLRATLDKLLANRLPDVELLTTGGPGVPMLAASYAAERSLAVAALVPEYGRWPAEAAVERRDAELVARADAALVVWADREPGVPRLLDLVRAKGIPVRLICAPEAKVKPLSARESVTDERRGLPD